MVPALTLFFGLPIRSAIGASLIGVIATSAGVAAFAPAGRGADVSLALRLEVGTTAGAIAGGLVAGYFNPAALHLVFGIVLFLTAGYTLFKSRRGTAGAVDEALFREDYRPVNWPIGLSGSGIAGMISGLLGIGGGFIKVPLMYTIMNIPLGIATATSNFMVGITAAASAFVYYGRGEINPVVVVPTSAGIFLGAMTGAYLLGHLRATWVRTALVALLIILGVHMLIGGVR